MPIRSLQYHLSADKLRYTTPLSALQYTRLGIDILYWLRDFVRLDRSNAYGALGGSPLGLPEQLGKFISQLRRADIIPVVVFPGLPLVAVDPSAANPYSRPDTRDQSWQQYLGGRKDSAAYFFSTNYHATDLLNAAWQFLVGQNVECIRAPYYAHAQLAYMESHPMQYVHSVYSSNEQWLFGTNNVIFNFVFDGAGAPSFIWSDRRAVAVHYQLSLPQFVDAGVLCGSNLCSTVPGLVSDTLMFNPIDIFKLVSRHQSAYGALYALADSVTNADREHALRILAAVRHGPILHDNGHVGPPVPQFAPADLDVGVGAQLPPQVYQHMSLGLVDPTLVSALSTGMHTVYAPYCGGATSEVRAFTDSLRTDATRSLALLTGSLPHHWAQRRVVSTSWFDPKTEHVIHGEGAPDAQAYQHPIVGTPEQKTHIALISRVASLIPPKLSPVVSEWRGVVSRDVLVFSTQIFKLYQSLRTTCEASVVALYLTNAIDSASGDATDNNVATALPFRNPPSSATGCLAWAFLQNYLQLSAKNAQATVFDQTTASFKSFDNVRTQIAQVYSFWKAVVEVLTKLQAYVPKDVVNQLDAADKFLKPIMASLNVN
ncbi:PIN domain-like protein [Ramicandelaber brevisporus]|nr:PIN domain-like protein [Ramicandelaber brevisporus]